MHYYGGKSRTVVSERECPIKHEILYIKQLCNIDKTVYVDKLFLIV